MASICCLAKSRFANSLLASAAESASCSLSRSNNFQIRKPLGTHFLSNSPYKNEHFTKTWKESYTFWCLNFWCFSRPLSRRSRSLEIGSCFLEGNDFVTLWKYVCFGQLRYIISDRASQHTQQVVLKGNLAAQLFSNYFTYQINSYMCTIYMVLNDAAKCLPQSDRHSPQRSAEGPNCLVLLFLSLAHVQIAASCKQKPNVMNAETNLWLVCRPWIRLATIACGHPC